MHDDSRVEVHRWLDERLGKTVYAEIGGVLFASGTLRPWEGQLAFLAFAVGDNAALNITFLRENEVVALEDGAIAVRLDGCGDFAEPFWLKIAEAEGQTLAEAERASSRRNPQPGA